MNVQITNRYQRVIDEITNFNWRGLERDELMRACRAYYYFFQAICRCHVHIACDLYPSDQNPDLAPRRRMRLQNNHVSLSWHCREGREDEP